MEQWIEFAKGPLFAFTFLIMILGLARHFIIQFYSIFISKGKQLKNVSWRKIFSDMFSWVVPVKHLIKGTRIFSTVSFIFHVAAILVSVFFIDHIVLWQNYLGIDLPSIGRALADILTLVVIGCILVLIACRIFVRRQREMRRKSDYVLLIMVLLPFLFGFLAGHPAINPFPWNTAMLIHILSGEALFVVIPFTKLSHIVLYFFDRLSVVHWQLKPGAGDKVAKALFGEEAKV
ncbi:respiratory nitrate reductase subunit gamma [bacterium BMS3Abin03]|nr:respiratory nitrate reductase subunit gamma [bacterium BMS3Abin03]MCG6959345.1 respiratory nitrate reductase subunit gamma [bacterium BMS3Abin03]